MTDASDNGGGYGQLDPSDALGDFNPQAFAIRQALSAISTVKIVLVRAVDTDKKTVDVQPMVNQIDGDNNVTEHGTISGVPYAIWQYGKNAVIADPVVGDRGILLCADRDISAVKSTRAIAQPGSLRKFSPSDGIYLGGVLNDDPEQWIKWNDDGIEITAKHGNKLTSDATGWKFIGNVTMENNLQLAGQILSDTGGLYPGSIHVGGTLTGDTDVIAGGISGKTHKHQYLKPTGSSTPADTGSPE